MRLFAHHNILIQCWQITIILTSAAGPVMSATPTTQSTRSPGQIQAQINQPRPGFQRPHRCRPGTRPPARAPAGGAPRRRRPAAPAGPGAAWPPARSLPRALATLPAPAARPACLRLLRAPERRPGARLPACATRRGLQARQERPNRQRRQRQRRCLAAGTERGAREPAVTCMHVRLPHDVMEVAGRTCGSLRT